VLYSGYPTRGTRSAVIESIKKDRVTQLLIVAVVIVAIVACTIFAAAAWRYSERSQIIAPTLGPVPTLRQAQDATPIVYKFEDTGDKVVFFDAPASGAGLIGFGHNGEYNFIVNLMKDDGTFIDQPVNAIGAYKGEKTLVIDKGRYMLEITADGDWYVVVLPPQ